MEQDINLEETIKKLNRQWMEAYTKRDDNFLSTYMAGSYISTFPDGSIHDKISEIESVRSGSIKIIEMNPIEMQVQIYNNNTAILTGQSKIVAIVNGKSMSDNFRFTDVWVKIEGSWQAVASQVTRIAK